MNRRSLLTLVLATTGAFGVPVQAFAQEFPAKPIRILVPYDAGGIADLVARLIGDKLTGYWGQQVVVENKPGAGGSLALETMVRDADDGYTVLIGTASEVTIGPIFRPDSVGVTGSRTIAIITQSPMVLVAGPAAGFSDWAGFMEAAASAPDPLAYSSAGNGTITHVTGEGVALAAGVPLLHIPYSGGSPATLGAVSGEVDSSPPYRGRKLERDRRDIDRTIFRPARRADRDRDDRPGL
jgi:tripartite-type tricarboxylate transporter receptor subunit TctC